MKIWEILGIMGGLMIALSILVPANIYVYKAPNNGFSEKAYIQHGIIRINNDTEFSQIAQQEDWPGDGSENNPYIVEGYEIDAQGEGNCIYIGNTTVHFIIRNCYLHNTSYHSSPYFEGAGITLYNTTSGIIENNTCSNNGHYGIYLYSSSSNTVSSNTCNNNGNYGIFLYYYSDNNTVSNNTCRDNGDRGIFLYNYANNNKISGNTCNNNSVGISLYSSGNNTISNNICDCNQKHGIYLYCCSDSNTILNNLCRNNVRDGILLFSSGSNILSNNSCGNNDRYGILLCSSSNNTIVDNLLYNNTNYGIYILSGTHNRIYNNFFCYNHDSGDTFNPSHIQAYDDGTNNSWNSSSGVGNYWHDWANNNDTNDMNNDGIVDWPYPIDGSASAKDHYPLKNPTVVPEFSSLNLMPIILAIFVMVYLRTKKSFAKYP